MRWKKLTFSVAAIALLIGSSEFCKKQTAGFTTLKVQRNFDLAPVEASGKVHLSSQEINAILDQPFHYLGRGKQSFVFASEDNKYVLKLFNNRYQRKVSYFSLLSHLPFFQSWAKEKAEYNRYKLHLAFTSYQIARDMLQEETGLVYLHNAPRALRPLHIIDRLGIHHTLSPESTAFVIQKRAQPFYPTFLSLKKEGNHEKARVLLASLFDLLIARYQKEIFDNDPLLRTNFGFIQDKAVEIDVGPFSLRPEMKSPTVYSKEILRITTSLRHFLEENYQELLPELEQQTRYKLQLSPS